MMDNDQDKEEENIQNMLQDNIHKRGLEEEFQDFIEEKFESSSIEIQVHSFQFMSEMVQDFLKQKNLKMINRNSQPASSPSQNQESQNQQIPQQQPQGQDQKSPIAANKQDSFDFDPNEIQGDQIQQNNNDSLIDEDLFGEMEQKKQNPSSINYQKQSQRSSINQPQSPLNQEPSKFQDQANTNSIQQDQQQKQNQSSQIQQQANQQLTSNDPHQAGNNQNDQDPSYPDDTMAMPDFPMAGKPYGMNVTQAFANLSAIAKPCEISKFIGTDDPVKLIDEFIIQQKQKEVIESGGGDIVNCQKVELNKIGKYIETYPDKKPSISIQSYRVLEEGGFLKQKYVLYTVNLSELKWTCYRRYSDFALLRDIFESQFPGYFIPPLPKKTLQRKFEPEYLQKRMKILEQFMEAVLESELLKNSQYFENFLFIQDETRYRKVALNVKEGPTELNQFFSIDGKINCYNSSNFTNYGLAFRGYTASLTDLYGKAKTLTKEVITNLDGTQKSLKALSSVFSDLSKLTNEFNKQNQIGVNEYLQRLYEENSKFLKEYADVLDTQHQLFKDHIFLKMRYEKKVCFVFEEMATKRQKLQQVYQDAISKLNIKKRKLFEKKDMKAWELDPTVQVDQSELLLDDKKAFKYMLPKDTNIIKMMNQKINFFSMNLFYETRKYLKIRETKISQDFIEFTKSNGELLTRLKLYHDSHLEGLNVIAAESQNNFLAQFEQDKKNIEQTQNNTFFTETYQPKKVSSL